MESGSVDRWQGGRYKRRVVRHVAQLTYLVENVIEVAFLLSAWCVGGTMQVPSRKACCYLSRFDPKYRRECPKPESSFVHGVPGPFLVRKVPEDGVVARPA